MNKIRCINCGMMIDNDGNSICPCCGAPVSMTRYYSGNSFEIDTSFKEDLNDEFDDGF